jgi:hypothetical protein
VWLAPVFVLVAIGNIMNILTTRLGRMVDRSRHLQMLHAGTKGSEHDAVVIEMRHIDKRIAHIGRALLMLFLFTDTGMNDAPTLVREGSHTDVAELLKPHGEAGLSFMELAQLLDTLPERPVSAATGAAGTVYLCHPFLVHRAQDHRGTRPKIMAQPPLMRAD